MTVAVVALGSLLCLIVSLSLKLEIASSASSMYKFILITEQRVM